MNAYQGQVIVQTAETIKLFAQTTIAVAAAAGLLTGLYHWVGPLASIALISALLMLVVVLAAQRGINEAKAISRAVARMDYHLAPNGNEYKLPEELRNVPMREMLADVVIEQRNQLKKLDKVEAAMADTRKRLLQVEEVKD